MESQTFADQLSDSAREPLAVLREALENRLATLEEVLADPSRDESLAGLILDLSRIATEEAQAAAFQACVATRAEADREITELRTSAKAALEAAQSALRSAQASLEQEHAIGVDLRRAKEQAHLEIQKQAELLAAREQLEASLKRDRDQLEAEVARHRTFATGLLRTTTDAQQLLETERASARKASDEVAAELVLERESLTLRERARADLQTELDVQRASGADVRGAVERAEARVAWLEREQEATRAGHNEVIADLAREREAAAGRERAYAELNAELEAERGSAAELRRAAGRATELEATLGRETSEGRALQQELSSALARQLEAAAPLQKALAEGEQALAAAHADVQAERTSNADLRRAVESADYQLASSRANETQTLANHDQLVAETDRLREETEGLRSETQELRAELEAAGTRLDALATERDSVGGELRVARKWIDELRDAEAEFGSPSQAGHPPPAASSPATPGAAPAEDDGWQPVRFTNRYVFSEEIAVQINGDPGRLFDLSISGCQLLSLTALKPNQIVKVTLPDREKPLVCTGTVMWTRLEPPAAGQGIDYRAGVRFIKADELAIDAYAARHGATT